MIEPLKAGGDRVRGEAIVDAKGQLEVLRVAPSKVPLLLKSIGLRFEFADTACGRQPVVIGLEGEGIAVFIETKFRSRSVLQGHARLKKK